MAKGVFKKKREGMVFFFGGEGGKGLEKNFWNRIEKVRRKNFSAKHWKIMKTRSLSQRQTALR